MARLPPHLAVASGAFLLLLVVVSPCHAAAGGGPRPTRLKAVAMPVSRDDTTKQYVATFQQRTPRVAVKAVVDLSGGATLWVDCYAGYVSSSYAGVPCGSKSCRLVKSPSCYIACLGSPASPACLNRTCTGHAENTVTSSVGRGNVITDVLSLPTTFHPARGPGPLAAAPEFLFTCGPTSLTEGLAGGATGMVSLSRARFALPTQLAGTFRFSRRFALCLPSAPADAGVVVFGDARYVFDDLDHSNSLLYTPLIRTDKSTEYFISLKRIVMDDRAVPLNATLLDVGENGMGGTKLSTVSPYTVLETSIHEAVTSAFAASMATAGIPRVPAVAPFELCYDRSKMESSAIAGELIVPVVELYVQSEVKSKVAPWMVRGVNLMVRAGDEALCLAVVDGGVAPETSVVIGGHMMEEILLVFDLEKSRLGFTPNLGAFGLSCSKFRLG
uniref:Peptidase A1 domain-containing protein n=1 Tax=Oryza punctata TaxID=4537 RepID=A0A0E0M1G7_ORYPU